MSTPSAKVAALSEAILESLLREQKKAAVPKGMLKCPECGAAVEPTKNGRVKTHDADPYERLRCPASGKPWKQYGVAPKTVGATTKKRKKTKTTPRAPARAKAER